MKNLQKGNRFSSTNQPAKNGRKPLLYTQLVDAGYDLSHDEYKRILNALRQKSKDELVALAEAKDTPIWLVTICRALYKDAGKGKTDTVDKISDRLYGKPKQGVDVTSGGQAFELKVVQTTPELADKVNGYLDGSGLDGEGV